MVRTARLKPDTPALLQGLDVVADYQTFAARAAAIGAALQADHGIGKGDRVAIFMTNRTQYLEAMYGIWFAGAAAVPINAKLHAKEAAWIIENAEVNLAFTSQDVDGALRALRAAKAAGIKRVVMTSSAVAVMDSDLAPGKTAYDEENWTDLNHAAVTPYGKSKTLAERAAWNFVTDEAPEISLTTINPVLVTGPPLDNNFGTSVSIVQRLLTAKDPMIPNFGFPIVDVRDVAEMHVRALKVDESVGKRILAVDGFLWFMDIAKMLKAQFPDRKIVTLPAPNFMVRLLAIFDKSIRQVVPILGKKIEVSNARAQEIFGMEFIPAADSIQETAAFLVENDLV
ncbi:MAG: hypothetical protein COC12_13875 [Rhodobacteraceae bacterium]|nr:MAG: hypothetical protein COC12_13875 [Paracoccaceae bacterium]